MMANQRTRTTRTIHASILICLMLGCCMVSMAAVAEETVRQVRMQGWVDAVYDDEDVLSGVQLETDSAIINVTFDAKGKELADLYDGLEVQITGTIKEINGEKWLTVSNYKVLAFGEEEESLDTSGGSEAPQSYDD